MPHLAFYAARDDVRGIIDFVINEVGCTVFESYSQPAQHLRELSSSDAALSVFDADLSGLIVRLYCPSMGGRHSIRTIGLASGTASWRERIEGWGLIQLLFPRVIDGRLHRASTNHNSEARARAWAPRQPELPPVEEWDFKEVGRVSSKINRFIRKQAVERHEGTCVLGGAKALTADGAITFG